MRNTDIAGVPPLRLHHFLPFSRANGPGIRAVVWVQGCSLGCPGCFNPETHRARGGTLVPIDELVARIQALGPGIEGVTLSGGEPLQQWRPVGHLLRLLRNETSLSTVLFTGYTVDEIRRMGRLATLAAYVDVLIAGRYDPRQRLARGLRGSANKTVEFFTSRYELADLAEVPQAEVIVGQTGEITLTGIDPIRW